MSIQQVQTKNILELIAQSYFVGGINPEMAQLFKHLSTYFSKHPAGQPVDLDVNVFRSDLISNVDSMNDFMASMIVNMDTIYETCADHVEQTMMQNTVLRTHLDRLKIKRKVMESRVDDFLLGIYNSDGYFYSFSDSFADTSYVDLTYTSAFVDTISTTVSIPSVSSLSRLVSASKVADPIVQITDKNGNSVSYTKKTDFANAVDGMTNTAWFIEVRTTAPAPITATVDMTLSTSIGDTKVTKVDLIPYGVTPVQCGINAYLTGDNGIQYTLPFSNQIKTSADKMSFIGDQIEDNINRLVLQLSKAQPDYYLNDSQNSTGVYVFGFKEIVMTEQYYDTAAVMVSQPFGLPLEIADESAIDGVSLVVEDYAPTNTEITYYVAADNVNATTVSDFNWRQIVPLASGAGTVVNFDGSFDYSKMIRKSPRNANDLKLLDLNTTSPDLSKRNPTPSYLVAADAYRLTTFTDEVLANSLKLEEGINTTRIFYTEYDADAMSQGFTYWKTKFDDTSSYETSYGEIDSGHEFFYGADVGESLKSVYVETFLETDREWAIFLKECSKSDVNSKLWHIRLFLNGREIANMPVGTDRLTVPWKLKEGTNHIVAMISIPAATVGIPSPYIGTFNIMGDSNLFDYGTVKLDNWTYVDLYKLQNNQTNEPNSFTIYNSELISRKKPTNNFRLSYKKSTTAAPSQIRVRADLTRTSQYAQSTPIIDLYRVRFSYV